MARRSSNTSARKTGSRSTGPRKPPAGRSGAGKRRWWPLLLKIAGVLLLAFAALMLYLQADVTRRFEGQRWTEPASVYARVQTLREGDVLSETDLLLELKLLGYRETKAPKVAGEYAHRSSGFLIRARGFTFADGTLPERGIEVGLRGDRISLLRDATGKELDSARLDPVLLGRFSARSDEDRELLPLSAIPKTLIDTLLVTEDQHFYQHFGISPSAIARAAWANLRAGEAEQGASTITQQLVKNYFLNSERSWWRKIREALMAIVLERNYSKDEILEAYLNEIYFGQDGQRAIHGVSLASRYYFGKPVAELDPAETALLVGLIRGPSYYSPWKQTARAKARRDFVLARRQQVGQIDAEELARWQQAPLGVLGTPRALSGKMPAVLDLIKRELRADLGQTDTSQSGLQVFTSVDPVLQRKTELVVEKGLQRLDPNGPLQAAVIVTDRQQGRLRAIVAGRDASFAGFNRALDAKRPVGSTLKPMIYYAALKQSSRFDLGTTLQDSAFVMRADDGATWQPKNYDGRAHGIVPLHRALAESLNLATARLAMEVSLPEIESTLKTMGLQRDIHLWPSLALGALELSPMDVATLYSGLANGSSVRIPKAIRAVRRDDGKSWLRPDEVHARLQPGTAFLVDYALQEVVRDGTGKSLGARMPELNVAGKTGTTNDQRDSWFAGFDGEHLAVFWVGRDDNQSTGLTGASGAMQLFSDWLNVKGAAPLSLELPSGVRFAFVDGNGSRYALECPGTAWLPVMSSASAAPAMGCP
ncbi:penicillin-binding protein 1B [Permianibacter sp. IMCC34836]|uniref:penicillin-binding protein 1B n=1 Tax=Permianibacter fluminis TaxID=2738515 RepID=UPI001555EA82|nr:penicillin-binding protein 1B [Permianibacter fluminis]NQD36978.1 penicillin-binding protein 1B [Permianibacter fluminis]